jgi:dienelactone hydrolase
VGGYGTWDLVSRRPELFAAAIPVSGGGDPAQAAKLAKLPIWAFHGDADPLVPVERARDMIAAIKKAGGEPKYTEYKGVGHDSWTRPTGTTKCWTGSSSRRRGSEGRLARALGHSEARPGDKGDILNKCPNHCAAADLAASLAIRDIKVS